MSRTATALIVLVAAAVVVHLATGLDWPWATVAGAAVALAVRAVIDRRDARPPRRG